MADEQKMKDEYLDVSHNMRAYINVRFAQLTLYLGITAALFNVVFSKGEELSTNIIIALKVGGIITGVVFLIMEKRSADFFHHYKDRAKELEKVLEYKQHTSRPEGKIITATNAVYFLICSVTLFWLLVLICPCF